MNYNINNYKENLLSNENHNSYYLQNTNNVNICNIDNTYNQKSNNSLVMNSNRSSFKYKNNLNYINAANNKIQKYKNKFKFKRNLYYCASVILGQVIAIIGVINGFFSCIIQNYYSFNFPILMTFMYYFVLLILILLIKAFKNKKLINQPPKLIYIVLSITDSQANLLNIFVFTKLKFSYPFVINISSYIWTFLLTLIIIKSNNFKLIHYLSLLITSIGILFSIIFFYNDVNNSNSTYNKNNNNNNNNFIIGLLICLASSLCYSLSAIFQEKYLNNNVNNDSLNINTNNNNNNNNDNDNNNYYCITEYLLWLGIFGSILTLIECFLFNEISKVYNFSLVSFNNNNNNNNAVLKLICFMLIFITTIVAMAIASPYYINKFSATYFNTSLLFQIFWSYMLDLINNGEVVSQY